MCQAVTSFQNAEARWREHKRLRQEWSRLLPRKNPYTRRWAEANFWLLASIRLRDRPQSREPGVRSSSDTPESVVLLKPVERRPFSQTPLYFTS